MSEFALLKKVARNIRYRNVMELSDLVVSIDSWDNIENILINTIRRYSPSIELIKFKPSNPISFLRYGLLDIEFSIAKLALLRDSVRGVKLLHQFGWLGETFEEDDELSCLAMLNEDIERKSEFLRLYLNAQKTIALYESEFLYSDVVDANKAEYVMERLAYYDKPTYDFPNQFKLNDAFLTNVSNFGLWKHFYL